MKDGAIKERPSTISGASVTFVEASLPAARCDRPFHRPGRRLLQFGGAGRHWARALTGGSRDLREKRRRGRHLGQRACRTERLQIPHSQDPKVCVPANPLGHRGSQVGDNLKSLPAVLHEKSGRFPK